MKRLLVLGLMAAATIGVTNAGTVSIRPRITGGGNSLEGRCIVRIMVDDRANVSMRGDTIFVESLSGRDARDDGSECTSPMPPARFLSNFQFRGIDGRGEVRLVEDPRSGREPRVSIYDSKGGEEGYTFEWRWTATQAGNWNDGRRNDGRWNDPGRGRATWSDVMQARSECESAVVNEIQRTHGASDVRFQSMNADNNPGRNDYINGRGRARRNGVDREFTFSCRADLERGRVRDVEVHPSGNWTGNFGDRPNRFDMGQARNTCTTAVQDDLRRRGYSNVRVTQMDLDNNPGRNDYIVGSVEASRGGFALERFNFNCRADFSSGRVYAVQTNRR